MLTPILVGVAFSVACALLLPPARLGLGRWTWLALVIVAATFVVRRAGAVARSVAPLALLLQLGLVFPDEAPSRYRKSVAS